MTKHLPFRNRVDLLKNFCETNKRLPSPHRSELENKLYYTLKAYSKINPTIAELYIKYKTRRRFPEVFEDFKAFCLINKRLPKNTIKDEEELKLNRFMYRNRMKPEIISFINNYQSFKYGEIKSEG